MKKLFALSLLLASFSVTYAQTANKARLDQFFDRLHEKNKAMGSIIISKDGNPVYAKAIGYGQISGTDRKPLAVSTKYRVGSVTKMFTAIMILQLVEEGKLKLTDKLDKFFPQVPNAGKITIAHILAHKSGIREATESPELKPKRITGLSKEEMVTIIAASAPGFEPGEKYAYSSSGYFLLGMIVEKVTGKSYQEALAKRITTKIGLKDTYLGTGSVDLSRNESFSYKPSRDWEQQPETHLSILFGSGAMISTAEDMSMFIQALFNGKLVSKESLGQMMQQKFGMDTFTYDGKIFYGHTGGIDGFGAWLIYQPEEKLAVSYATNGKAYPVADIINGVTNIYWNKPFAIPTFESLAMDTEVMDKYLGVYSREGAPVSFTVTREGNTIFVQMTGQSAIPLEPTAPGKFKIEQAGIVIEFDTDKSQMIIRRNGGERVLTKQTN